MSISGKIQDIYYNNLCFQLQGRTLEEYAKYCKEEEEMDEDELYAHLKYKADIKKVLANSVYWLTTREWRYIEEEEKLLFPSDFQEHINGPEPEVAMPLDYDVNTEQLILLRALLQGSDEAAYYASVIIHNLASEIEARKTDVDRSTHTGWDHW